jgi:hypothetical protein
MQSVSEVIPLFFTLLYIGLFVSGIVIVWMTFKAFIQLGRDISEIKDILRENQSGPTPPEARSAP